jgi:imidazole glycerol phosphate synthase subunit HisF
VSGTFERIRELVNKGDWVISDHAYKALADDEIAFEDVLSTRECQELLSKTIRNTIRVLLC